MVVSILALVWVAMVVYIGARIFSRGLGGFRVGLASCLPADFPHYPRASLASFVISDSLGNCTIQYQTRDSAADVRAFYETNLNQGDWTVTRVSDQVGLIGFQRISRPETVGYVQIVSFPGQQTQFQIQIKTRLAPVRSPES